MLCSRVPYFANVAADVIGRNPTTLQLRYLQTLREIGATQNSTVVFPMPIDLMKPVLEALARGAENSSGSAGEGRSLEAGPNASLPEAEPAPAAPAAVPRAERPPE